MREIEHPIDIPLVLADLQIMRELFQRGLIIRQGSKLHCYPLCKPKGCIIRPAEVECYVNRNGALPRYSCNTTLQISSAQFLRVDYSLKHLARMALPDIQISVHIPLLEVFHFEA